jgi:hypothetical protein
MLMDIDCDGDMNWGDGFDRLGDTVTVEMGDAGEVEEHIADFNFAPYNDGEDDETGMNTADGVDSMGLWDADTEAFSHSHAQAEDSVSGDNEDDD